MLTPKIENNAKKCYLNINISQFNILNKEKNLRKTYKENNGR